MNTALSRPCCGAVVLLFVASTCADPDPGSDLYSLSLQELINIRVEVAAAKPTEEFRAFGAVEKISEAEWRRFGAVGPLDVFAYTPGVDVHQSLGGSRTLSIRGYAGSTASARGKAVLYDGIPLNGYSFATSLYSKSLLPLDLLRSVEMAKGPVSSFYGPDAFHGAILMLPWRGEESALQAHLRLGSQEAVNAGLRAYYEINDHWTGTSNLTGYRQQNVDVEAPGFTESLQARYQSYAFSQHLDYGDHRLGVLYGRADTDDHYDIFRTDSRGRADSSETALAYYRGHIAYSDSITLAPAVWYNHSAFDFRYFDYSRAEAWQDTQMGARLTGAYSGENQRLSLGLEYVASGSGDSYSYAVAGPKTKSAYAGLEKNVSSLLMHYQAELADNRLGLDLGFRYDAFSNTGQAEFSPKLGLIWFPAKHHALKWLVSDGYRAPAAGEISGTSAFLGNDELTGERLRSYEFIYFYRSERLKYSQSVFVSRWQDAIITAETQDAIDAGLSGEFVNKGKNSARGLEGSLSYALASQPMLAFLNWSYVRSENVDTDAEYDLFPEWKLAYGLRYQAERWDWSLSQVHKRNRKSSGLATAERLPDFSELTAQLGYRMGDVRLSLALVNVLNNDNVEPSIWNVDGGLYGAGINARLALEYSRF